MRTGAVATGLIAGLAIARLMARAALWFAHRTPRCPIEWGAMD
jgi:hypothetical protein